MAVLYTNDWNVKQYGYTNPHLWYRLVVTLNSQSTANKTSNITCQVFQKSDGTGSYSGNSYVFLSLLGHTSVSSTDTEYVAPVNIKSNTQTDWEELESLKYTADFPHKSDGTLTVYFNLKIDRTTSTNANVPDNADLSTGDITVTSIIVSPSTLNTPSTLYVPNTSGTVTMSFSFNAAAGVDHHTITVSLGGSNIIPATQYNTSGAAISLTNSKVVEILRRLGNGGSPNGTATVTLESFTAGNVSIGTSSKDFTIVGRGMDVKVGGAWKRGMAYVKVSGTWRAGVVWVNVNGTWKKGISTS